MRTTNGDDRNDGPIFAYPRIARRHARTSPRTGGAEAVDVYGIATPDGDFIPITGTARHPREGGPPSFREPGVVAMQRGDLLVMLRVL